MVSIGRSSVAFLLCRSSSRLHPTSSTSSIVASRRNFITAATAGFVATTTTSLLIPSYARGETSSASCESSTTMAMSSSSSDLMTGYLNAADAAALDGELMSSPGFSLEQLMELAGLAVAEAVYQVVPPTTTTSTPAKKPRILLICGPGNNGGDGLVAARHLVMFGYECDVVYPKRSSKEHFINLVKQCEDVDVTILDEMPSDLLLSASEADGGNKYAAIVDAIFGFSFKGAPREPFATALKQMQEAQTSMGIPVISVDVPSGWNVDEGDVTQTGFVPQVLISLTTPKESSKSFPGRHFVGGRFLPPALAEKYKVKVSVLSRIDRDCLCSD